MDPHTRLLHAKAILWWIGAGSLSVSTIYFIGNICITIQVLQTKKFISWMPIMSGVTGAIGLGFMFPDISLGAGCCCSWIGRVCR